MTGFPMISPDDALNRYRDWLLVETIGDIEQRISGTGGRYELLGISLLLRKLLSDGLLAESIKRHAWADIRFLATPARPPDQRDDGWTLVFSPGTEDFMNPTTELTLDGFMATTIAYARDTPVSVLQYVRHFAHMGGGVHLKKTPDTRNLNPLDDVIPLPSQSLLEATDGWLTPLAWAGAVVCRAVRPRLVGVYTVNEALAALARPYVPIAIDW